MIVAPGKLVLAGEYAVLVPGGRGLALAVGPGVPAAARGERGAGPVRLSLPGGAAAEGRWDGDRLLFDTEDPAFRFARAALVALGEAAGPFTLDLELGPAGWSAQAGAKGLKPGLGGSAAATVAAVIAAARVVAPELGRGRLLDVALLAHWRAQGGRGSGIDVAACLSGGAVGFAARLPGQPPRVWEVAWPAAFPLLPVFTGASVATVDRLQAFEALRARTTGWIKGWALASNGAVAGAEAAMEEGSWPGFCAALAEARGLLLELGERAGLEMEGPPLEALADVMASLGSHKQSGAGGGDTGLALPRSAGELPALEAALAQRGLAPLRLTLAAPGPWTA